MTSKSPTATLTTTDSSGGVMRYVEHPSCAFDPSCFDVETLQKRGIVNGAATAGRGNTVFFTLQGESLVLRHYRRGGLVQHVSKAHYLFLGMQRTRAFLEFDILLQLQEQGLPAPRPYACKVSRHGLFYTASLVTYRLPGRTLAECMNAEECLSDDMPGSDVVWSCVGEAIARFHAAGIYHADLNAHNIMLDDNSHVSLIDFDRSRERALPINPTEAGWCFDNMNRLERSINKVVAAGATDSPGVDKYTSGIRICKSRWAECLSV